MLLVGRQIGSFPQVGVKKTKCLKPPPRKIGVEHGTERVDLCLLLYCVSLCLLLLIRTENTYVYILHII